MIGSLKISLLMGPVPIPVPHAVIEALASVKVDMGSGETQSGFELNFDLPVRSPLRAIFLGLGSAAMGGVPFMRVVLTVTMNGRTDALVDGVATDIEAQPTGNGNAKLVPARAARGRQRWLGKSAQGDKWSFCLTAGTLCPRIRRNHGQTSTPEPLTGIQSESGAGCDQGPEHVG